VKYLSVCSGIEAASVAWHHMGWEPVAFSEIEKFPSAVLAHHYPSVPNWGDMTKFKEWPDANIDVLVGGTPCQSFSVAGLRKGLDDPRGNLMLTFGSIAQRYRPQWLVWENVPGVLSSNGGRDFGSFLGMLAELGYGFAYRVLDAQFYRVAQRRRRLFLVGHLGDWHRAAAVLFERHSLSGHPAPSRQAREGVAKCVTTGIGKRYDPETDTMIPTAVNWDGQQTSQTLTNRLYGGMGAQQMPDKGNLGAVLVPQTFKVRGGCEGGGKGYLGSEEAAFTLATTQDQWLAQPITMRESGQGYWMQDEIAGTLRAEGEDRPSRPSHVIAQPIAYNITFCDANGVRSDRPNGGLYVNETDVTSTLTEAGVGTNVVQPIGFHHNAQACQLPTAGRDTSVSDALTCSQQAAVAHTLQTQCGFVTEDGTGRGSPLVPIAMQVRRLTPVECERLQGFPDGYTNIPWRGKEDSPDGPRYKALGNSMAVPVMRWIGERINEVSKL